MRLRYFHIRNYPPLHDIKILFSAQSPLKSINAIHFVVGVNGSGKTHLLQALTETFLCLEKKRSPRFSATLVYELGNNKDKKKTYIFDHNQEQGTSWWQSSENYNFSLETFKRDMSELRQGTSSEWMALIANGGWPGSDIGLPASVLAYTTGLPNSWYDLFARPTSANALDLEAGLEERPLGWTMAHEIQRNSSELASNRLELSLEFELQTTEICRFITPLMLKLAVVAVTLNLALDELKQHRTEVERKVFINSVRDKTINTGLRGLLSQVGWVWPVSLIIECQPDDDVLRMKDENDSATKFWKAYLDAATTILTEPEVGIKYRVVFDVGNTDKKYALESLFNLSKSPFSIFQQLLRMHHDSLLDDLQMGIRKTDPDDILLFDELSDGEQMYLGRMALFHLLQGQDDALLLLDEPETHFNDRWKRDMVDIIDQVLGKQANHVLISTHSGITLTDVFTDEITVIEKDEFGHAKQKHLEGIHTFGATPDHPLRDVFGAPDTVGKRAAALLDVLLLCEPNKRIVEELFYLKAGSREREYDRLSEVFVKAVQAEFKDKHDAKRIRSIIETLCNVANDERYVKQPTVAALMKYFADSVGPGYYQFDLYRSVYRLTKGDIDAA